MRGWLTVAMLGAALLATPVWGQRGFSRSGGAAPSSMVAGRAPAGVRSPVVAQHAAGFSTFNGGVFIGGGGPPSGVHPGFPHPGFIRPGFRFPHYPPYYGAYWPYGYVGYYPFYNPGYVWWDNNDQAYSAYAQQNYVLQQEVSQLGDEVARLRQQQAELSSAPPPPPAQSPPRQESQSVKPPTPTTLVFRDGRTEQVQNYAITGGTIWVLTDQRARRIPLSALDIPATKKANEARGVTFQLPATQ